MCQIDLVGAVQIIVVFQYWCESMYLLSIIIPHFNSPLKLKRLLQSIPNVLDIEVIIVDDRSDKDQEVYEGLILEYSKKENFKFLNNINLPKGAGTCRNIGLENSNSKWILFADADDYFLKDFFDIVKVYFDTDFDIIFFSPTSWDDITQTKSDRHIEKEGLIRNYILAPHDNKNELNLKYKFTGPSSKLINSNLIKQNEIFFEQTIVTNDVMFSTKLGYFAKKIDASNASIYCITKDKGTLTQVITPEAHFTRLDVYIRRADYLKGKLSSRDFKILKLNGRGLLITSIKFNMGIKSVISTYRAIRRSNLRLIDNRFYNPFFLVSSIIKHIDSKKEEIKYKVK